MWMHLKNMLIRGDRHKRISFVWFHSYAALEQKSNHVLLKRASQMVLVIKNPPAIQETWDAGSIPESGRSLGEGHGNPLQYSCLENPTDWRAKSIGSQRVGHYWSEFPEHSIIAERRQVVSLGQDGRRTCRAFREKAVVCEGQAVGMTYSGYWQ